MVEQHIYNYFGRIMASYVGEDLPHNARRIFDLAKDFARMNNAFDSHPLCARLSQPVVEHYCRLWEENKKPAA